MLVLACFLVLAIVEPTSLVMEALSSIVGWLLWRTVRLVAPSRTPCPRCGNADTVARKASFVDLLANVFGVPLIMFGAILTFFATVGGFIQILQAGPSRLPPVLIGYALAAALILVGGLLVRRYRRRAPLRCGECEYRWAT